MAGENGLGQPRTTVDMLETVCQEVLHMSPEAGIPVEFIETAKAGLERIITANPSAYAELLERDRQRFEAGEEALFHDATGTTRITG